ncbi:MAG: UDP-N-acetylmuramoyl-tripeptide--D-alanyl-D-alanine ligase, partial [Steroidobacteraceae bacterium]
MKLPLARIANLLSSSGDIGSDVMAEGYSIDSRTLDPGELFFAVRGERLDGHDFVAQALQRGAVAAVVARHPAGRYAPGQRLLQVEDTLAALQKLASAVRRIWGNKLIAVTGSAGKTTTKEAIAHLLAVRFRVFKSQGNLNNHFGLPLQLLRLERSHDVAVVELGMSHAGEIAALARIAQPEIGVVTLVAPVHLEFFDSIEGIARAKQELIAALPEAGIAVLNADDPYVSQFGRGFRGRVLTFGISHPADFRAHKVQMKGALGSSFEVISHGATAPVSLPLLGLHNVYNALAALAVASERGVPLPEAASALASFAPVANRGELLRLAGATVINDCYNCNPAALNAMVDALMELPAARHIVVAGGMLELG